MTHEAAVTPREQAKHTLARNTLWNYLGFGINIVTNLLLFPLVVRQIGETAAGIWLLLGSVTGYMGLLELGIVPALTQHVASALARGAREEVNRSASTALVLLLALMLLALQVLWLIPALIGLLRIPAELEKTAITVFAIAISGFALKMPLAAFQALLLGSQRQDRCNQLWVVQAAMRTAFTIGVLLAGGGVIPIVAAEALVYPLSAPLQIRWVLAEVPDLRLSWHLTDRSGARSLMRFGGTLLGITISSLVIEQTDRLVIGAFRPVADVTHFSAAWKLYMLVYTVPTILLAALGPMAADFHGRGDVDGLRRLFLTMTKYAGAVALPLTIALALSAGTLLRWWMGPDFVDARSVVQVLAAAFSVTCFNHAGYSILIGTRRIRYILWIYFVPQAILNLGVSIWLIRPLGIVGVALGTALPALLLEYPYLRRLLRIIDVRWRDLLVDVLWPAVSPAAVAFAPLLLVFLAAGPLSSLLPFAAAACGLLYVALFWRFSLLPAERQDLRRLLLARFRPGALGAASDT